MNNPKSKKFKTGESRYCQRCGKESLDLFQVTEATQTINQLQYCEDCKDKYKKDDFKQLSKLNF